MYSLKFLSYIGDRNLREDIVRDYSITHFLGEKELSVFEGNLPKFGYGQYVKCGKFFHSNSSRVFFVKYENYKYIYFVQKIANSDLFEGGKEWVDEMYLQ